MDLPRMSQEYPVLSKIDNQAKEKLEKRQEIVFQNLEKRINDELTDTERERLTEPANAAILHYTLGRLLCSNTVEKRRLLEDILIQKAKLGDGSDKDQDYDRTIRTAYELTTNEIRLLVFIETYTTILCSIINGTGAVQNIEKLNSYLEGSHFTLEEIKKCENNFLLFEKAQYEHDLSALKGYHSEEQGIQYLCLLVDGILAKHYSIDLNSAENFVPNIDIIKLASYRLTNSGKIIVKCEVNNLEVNYVANDIFPLKLSDVIANNVYGLGNVAAKGDAM